MKAETERLKHLACHKTLDPKADRLYLSRSRGYRGVEELEVYNTATTDLLINAPNYLILGFIGNIFVYWLDIQVKLQFLICDALRDLVPFVQFKKHEKHPWRGVNFSKVAG